MARMQQTNAGVRDADIVALPGRAGLTRCVVVSATATSATAAAPIRLIGPFLGAYVEPRCLPAWLSWFHCEVEAVAKPGMSW